MLKNYLGNNEDLYYLGFFSEKYEKNVKEIKISYQDLLNMLKIFSNPDIVKPFDTSRSIFNGFIFVRDEHIEYLLKDVQKLADKHRLHPKEIVYG